MKPITDSAPTSAYDMADRIRARAERKKAVRKATQQKARAKLLNEIEKDIIRCGKYYGLSISGDLEEELVEAGFSVTKTKGQGIGGVDTVTITLADSEEGEYENT